MNAPDSALTQTVRNQRDAAAPARSAFVMANAGSGKTRVLTNRVARLLLTDVAPQQILCITFTKAAAAEMAERLFDMLGAWALADDDDLRAALAELEGAGAPERDGAALAKVRRLFARALETPGGLKIQTIHSFCENALRRFPLEAGAPPGFTVLEDAEARRMLAEALDALARRAQSDSGVAAALRRLSARHSEQQLRALLTAAAANRLDFEQARAGYGGLDAMIAALADALEIDPANEPASIQQGFAASLSAHDLERAHDALAQSGGNPAKYSAPPIKEFLQAHNINDQWTALEKLFLTGGGAPRKTLATKATDKADAWAKPYLNEQQAAFLATLNQCRALSIFHETAAHYRLASALIETYANAKAARAALDFDDLIARALALFTNADNAWVMYKLDYGIDHILIDEAQDTSPGQWAVIEALFADYLSGAGAREASRSFFAVGDMKQSIYSFQGADVSLFKAKEQDLGKRLAGVADYKNVPLTLSFRTSAPVLNFVDALFSDREAAEGLGDYPMPRHGVRRDRDAGLVELWPLTPRPETLQTNPWDAPVDAPTADHPVKTLSARIAATIEGWLNNKTLLESEGRPIAPDDIMILVQSRGALFEEIIRRLAQAGVPVAGADRLKLLEDPAIEDLLSYARFALSAQDDLSLAEVLKSPLFEFDDDADLFPLARHRAKGQSLWSALRTRADENPKWARAAKEIAEARAIALREGPYAFLQHALEAVPQSAGRQRFYERLSTAARDGVDEMLRQTLHFENTHPRSLRRFVAWFEENAGDIKREMDEAGGAVRVMTVHGAKGLEANIVFLIDAHRLPRTGADGALALTHAPLSVLAGAAGEDIEQTAAARLEKKRKAYEEYRRLFYVAATRARDRLYICGFEDGRAGAPREKETALKPWHALAQDAFDRLGEHVVEDAASFWDGGEPARRLEAKQRAPVEPDADKQKTAPPDVPDWLFALAAKETAAPRLAPSRLTGEADGATAHGGARVYSPALTRDRYFRGRTLHRLLELLPDVAPTERRDAADRLLMRLAPDVETAVRAQWRDEVIAILEDAQFAPVFAPGSRAEVAVSGAPEGARPDLIISGQIDRLAISGGDVLIVDYKTNRPPPADIRDADPAYITQLAAYRALIQEIYPGHKVRSALLWTYDARLAPAPDDLLDHAFARLLRSG